MKWIERHRRRPLSQTLANYLERIKKKGREIFRECCFPFKKMKSIVVSPEIDFRFQSFESF
jgi:hypothetical protein